MDQAAPQNIGPNMITTRLGRGVDAPPPPGYHLIGFGGSVNAPYAGWGKGGKFDEEVMNHLDYHKSLYTDGAGGIAGLFVMGASNLYASDRYASGAFQGAADAEAIIKNLARDKNNNIVESIKVITHSMGTAFAKGYIQAILNYAKQHNIVGVVVEFEADFAPFQPADQKAILDKNMGPTYQYSHHGDGVAGDDNELGAEKENTSSDTDQVHSLSSFLVGPLGQLGQVVNENGVIKIPERTNGIAIYDRNTNPIIDLTKRAVEKILK